MEYKQIAWRNSIGRNKKKRKKISAPIFYFIFIIIIFLILAMISTICSCVHLHQSVSQSITQSPWVFLFLLQVYRRSSDICLQLYEKELLTDSSFLRIYGSVTPPVDIPRFLCLQALTFDFLVGRLNEADFSPEQLAVVAVSQMPSFTLFILYLVIIK